MNINVYQDIKSGLQDHLKALNLSKSFNPNVVGFEPSKPTYPMVIIDEVRNIPFENYRGRAETVANLGYKVDVYAKQSGNNTKQDIARLIAKHCNDYLTCIGLKQVSWNTISNDGQNGDLYHIIIMYSASYFEQKQIIFK